MTDKIEDYIKLAEMGRVKADREKCKVMKIIIVYTVYRSDDQTTHIFSTPEFAKKYAESLPVSCVVSEYAVDCPERFYGEIQ